MDYKATWVSPESAADSLGFRQVKAGKWAGPCPVHCGDNKNGMTIVEKQNGDPAFTCHTAGCVWQDIHSYMRSIGLVTYQKADAPVAPRPVPRTVIEDATLFLLVAVSDVKKGAKLNPLDAKKLTYCAEVVRCHAKSTPAMDGLRRYDALRAVGEIE